MKETTSKQTKKNLKKGLSYDVNTEYVDYRGFLTELGRNFVNDFEKKHEEDPDYLLCALYVCLYNRGDCLFPNDEVIQYAQKKIKNCQTNDFKILEKIILTINDTEIEYILRDNADYPQIDGHFEDDITFLNTIISPLLHVAPGESVFQLGLGNGNFLVDSFIFFRDYDDYLLSQNGKVSCFSGVDSDPENTRTTKLRLNLLTRGLFDVNIINDDVLKPTNLRYSYGYTRPPIGQHQLFRNKTYKSLLYPDITFDNSFYEQWLYVDRLLYGLNDGGRAIALLHGKSLMQVKDNVYLQRLLDDGRIEGIIELHDTELLRSLGTVPYIVIFSNGNTKVKVTWEESIYNYCYKTDAGVNYWDGLMVIYYYAPDKFPDLFTNYTINEMKQFNSWIPSRMPTSSSEKGKENLNFVKDMAEVIQATQYTASDFEISDSPTGYKILTPADIDNGQIRWDDLKSVVINKSLFDKYVLKKDDLIMTNKTTKIKTAVVDISPEEKVIVTGGMLIIRPDTDKLNPTYLKMYLDSPEGDIALRTSQTGSSVINLSPVLVENIEIPMVDIEKQNKKADSYNSKLASVNAYRENIKKLEQDMKYIFDEEDG